MTSRLATKNPANDTRANEVLHDHLQLIYRRTDRLFAGLLFAQWLACIAAALWISPRTWEGAWSTTHIHVWAALLLGGAISSLPILLAVTRPGELLTRHVIAIAQMLTSALLIHLTGGRIETHFHIFGSLALLAAYRDWRVLVTSTIVVALDHGLRGALWPESVYGVLAAAPWRTLEHAGWVVFEDIFLFVTIRQSINEMRNIAAQQATLEATNRSTEVKVQERTADLQRAEERMRMIIDSVPNGVVMIDQAGAIKLANRKIEEIFGYSSEELLGEKIEILVPKEIRQRHPELRDAYMNSPEVRPMGKGRDLFGVRKDGSEFPVELGLNPLRSDEGLFVLAAVVDITERKKTELDLQLAEERLRMIIDSAPNGVVMVDEAGVIKLANRKIEEIFGYSREELLGEKIEILVPKEIRQRHPELRDTYMNSPEVRPMGKGRDLHGVRKDGSEFPVELGLNPLRTDEGLFVLAAVVDITERKKKELELQEYARQLETTNVDLTKTQAELQQKNQELDEFTYVASHDLQEPVRKLVSFSKLLEQDLGDALNEQAARDLQFIVNAAGRMRQLVQDLLALSRAGRSAMKSERISLDGCREDALYALQMRMEETRAKLQWDELPTVVGDHTMLTQLYQNLIGNALKFTTDEVPEVHLTVKDDGDQWILGVKDNGIGMKPEHAERIFKPFQRLHRRDQYEGTGIGLSICKKTVERHGGRLWVESNPGEGAHFKFTLSKLPENEICLNTAETPAEELLSC